MGSVTSGVNRPFATPAMQVAQSTAAGPLQANNATQPVTSTAASTASAGPTDLAGLVGSLMQVMLLLVQAVLKMSPVTPPAKTQLTATDAPVPDGSATEKPSTTAESGGEPDAQATQTASAGVGDIPAGAEQYKATATAYYPADDPIQGGFVDRQGKPLHTLQDYLEGKAPYVTVAMDHKLKDFPYGTKIRIPELEKKFGRQIDFRVMDTGGAFVDKGTSRIDICVRDRKSAGEDIFQFGDVTIVKV